MGASDSCLETSICPPAFIPDRSYEIKFNKNLSLRHQRNETQALLSVGTQWGNTPAGDSSCSTCISQVRRSGRGEPNRAVLARLHGSGLSSGCWRSGSRARARASFQSGSPSRLLLCRKSEILFPGRVSCRGDRQDDTLYAPESARARPDPIRIRVNFRILNIRDLRDIWTLLIFFPHSS